MYTRDDRAQLFRQREWTLHYTQTTTTHNTNIRTRKRANTQDGILFLIGGALQTTTSTCAAAPHTQVQLDKPSATAAKDSSSSHGERDGCCCVACVCTIHMVRHTHDPAQNIERAHGEHERLVRIVRFVKNRSLWWNRGLVHTCKLDLCGSVWCVVLHSDKHKTSLAGGPRVYLPLSILRKRNV